MTPLFLETCENKHIYFLYWIALDLIAGLEFADACLWDGN
jgi:hypothetical protein